MSKKNTWIWIIVIIGILIFINKGNILSKDIQATYYVPADSEQLCIDTGGKWIFKEGARLPTACDCPINTRWEENEGCKSCESKKFYCIMPLSSIPESPTTEYECGPMSQCLFSEESIPEGCYETSEECQLNLNIVCCKIYGFGVGMEEVNIRYTYLPDIKCKVEKGFTGGGRQIVNNSFCEAKELNWFANLINWILGLFGLR